MFKSVKPATSDEIAAQPELTPAELDAKLDKAAGGDAGTSE